MGSECMDPSPYLGRLEQEVMYGRALSIGDGLNWGAFRVEGVTGNGNNDDVIGHGKGANDFEAGKLLRWCLAA